MLEIKTEGFQRMEKGLGPNEDIRPVFQAIKNRGRGRPVKTPIKEFAAPRPFGR